MKNKQWLTLNAHGKRCLRQFAYAICAGEVLTSQVDYLYNKDLVSNQAYYPDAKYREPLGNAYCLTDLGIETIKHYFPKFKTKWEHTPEKDTPLSS